MQQNQKCHFPHLLFLKLLLLQEIETTCIEKDRAASFLIIFTCVYFEYYPVVALLYIFQPDIPFPFQFNIRSLSMVLICMMGDECYILKNVNRCVFAQTQ